MARGPGGVRRLSGRVRLRFGLAAGGGRGRELEAAAHVQWDLAVGLDVHPEQRSRGAFVLVGGRRYRARAARPPTPAARPPVTCVRRVSRSPAMPPTTRTPSFTNSRPAHALRAGGSGGTPTTNPGYGTSFPVRSPCARTPCTPPTRPRWNQAAPYAADPSTTQRRETRMTITTLDHPTCSPAPITARARLARATRALTTTAVRGLSPAREPPCGGSPTTEPPR